MASIMAASLVQASAGMVSPIPLRCHTNIFLLLVQVSSTFSDLFVQVCPVTYKTLELSVSRLQEHPGGGGELRNHQSIGIYLVLINSLV